MRLTDKSDRSTRRIYHLTAPLPSFKSINAGIPEEYATITYSSIAKAISAVEQLGPNCISIKHDFLSAFINVPVSPLDSCLLGFHWNESYYAEQFLPLGLRTAPYLFNLFPEVFHWIVEKEVTRKGPQIQVIQYLDELLLVLAPTTAPEQCSQTFKILCEEVGLAIKEAKNEQGSIASFARMEINTRSIVISLPEKKVQKPKSLVHGAIAQISATVVELQQITGYLSFVSTLVPLGRTFLRRLDNMEVYLAQGGRYQRRRSTSRTKRALA